VTHRLALLLPAVLLAVAACGPIGRPPNTPMGRSGVFEQIAVEGGTITSITSGDPGCDSEELAGNAVRVRVRAPSGTDADVYLTTYRNRPFWEAAVTASDACVAELAQRAGAPASAVGRLDISPYRAWGTGWTAELTQLLQRAMTTAAGDGGIPRGRDGQPLATPTHDG
jgi:hypothetical protein